MRRPEPGSWFDWIEAIFDFEDLLEFVAGVAAFIFKTVALIFHHIAHIR